MAESDKLIGHFFDKGLAAALADFLIGHTVCDLGCGQQGLYVSYLRKNDIKAFGYEGNPSVAAHAGDFCWVADLAVKQNFPIFDWAMSLEVAEHIPKEFEANYIDNLQCNRKGIIISWAAPNQGGSGHVNCKTPEQVIELMAERGYILDRVSTFDLRNRSELKWFKKNVSVFLRYQ